MLLAAEADKAERWERPSSMAKFDDNWISVDDGLGLGSQQEFNELDLD